MQKNTGHNLGIDLLRIVSMYMIVMIHILNKGGAASAVNINGGQIIRILYIALYSAVDSFALISGYVGFSEYEKPHEYKKIILLWLQVVFYGVIITIIFLLSGKFEVGISDFCSALLPITRDEYWYFTSYTCVFIFIPWINRLIRFLDLKNSKYLFTTIFIVFSVYGTFAWGIGSDPFYLNNGYSFVWLLSLYIIGSIIKKHELTKKIEVRSSKLILLWISCLIFTWLYENISMIVTKSIFGIELGTLMFRTYLSSTIFIMSICIFFLFRKLHINSKFKMLIGFIAPSVFGVYLIHTQPLIYEHVLNKAFYYLENKNIFEVIITIFLSGLVIFLSCILIDKIRKAFFQL